jgi:hypothetical protein
MIIDYVGAYLVWISRMVFSIDPRLYEQHGLFPLASILRGFVND